MYGLLLIVVCIYGFLCVVYELIKVGVDVNEYNIVNDEILLNVVCKCGKKIIIKVLIKVGV